MPSCTHSTQAPDGSQPARPNPIDEILYYTILATSLRSLLPPPVIIVSSPSPFSSSSPRPRPRARRRACIPRVSDPRAAAHAFRAPRMHSFRCLSQRRCMPQRQSMPQRHRPKCARRRACIPRVRDPARLRACVSRSNDIVAARQGVRYPNICGPKAPRATGEVRSGG